MQHDSLLITFVCQYSTDKITKAFVANTNLVSLLITGHHKNNEERLIGHNLLDTYIIFGEKLQGVTGCTSIPA